MLAPKFSLPGDFFIPAIGYGVGTKWFHREGNDDGRELNPELINSVKTAIKLGYSHLDAAEIYGTERELGVAIKESGVPREKLFVASKVFTGIKDPISAIKTSLSRLQLDYVDLYLIHCPFFNEKSHGISIEESWKQMVEIQRMGLARSIGVSNFQIPHLQRVLEASEVKPCVNQIEFHPYLNQNDLVQFCNSSSILIEAYGPLVPLRRVPGGPLDEVVHSISARIGKSPSQILIRWAYQNGVAVVTTSGNRERQLEQLKALEFELSQDDFDKISEAGKLHVHRQYWPTQFEELESKNMWL